MQYTMQLFYAFQIKKKSWLEEVKIWQVAIVVTLISSASLLTSCTSNIPQIQAQNVLVFIGGLNTKIDTPCHEGTFDDIINTHVIPELGVANPYAQGCNNTNRSYLNESSSIIRFSYTGGTMDVQHGVWVPKTYNECDANNQSIAQDVKTFDDMLEQYSAVFPHATFTIVGHSLGGLVALQGAYDYEIGHVSTKQTAHVARIDKVITIDSPLEGIFITDQAKNWLQLSSQLCDIGVGVGKVISHDLVPLGKVSFVSPLCTSTQGQPDIQPPVVLSQCAARALAKANVGVVTFGNNKDALFCQPGWLSVIGQVIYKACDTQTLLSEATTFRQMYDYQTPIPPNASIVEKLAHDHLTLLKTVPVEEDVIRHMLAPIVTITNPISGNRAWFNGMGTPVHFAAIVHCLWGSVNHTEAVIRLADKTTISAGNIVPHASTFMLPLTGTITLPASTKGDTATLYVKAGGNACNYPNSIKSTAIPTDSDYLNGETQGVSMFLDGGKLAMGVKGKVYAARTSGDFFSNTSLDYSHFNQEGNPNSIQDVAWSHDGTKLAYLVTTSGGPYMGNLVENLFVTSSLSLSPQLLAQGLPGAVALTWNQSNDTIAVLEENIENRTNERSLTFHFKPSILVINVDTKAVSQQINLPASTNTSSFFCSVTCGEGRSRIQWGANGVFLISNGEVGSTLVTATGQYQELDTSGSMYSPDEAPLGALNQQGTTIAYPTKGDKTGQAKILLYQVNPSTGKATNPTTLGSFGQGSFVLGATVDFSPNGNTIGLCADKGVFVLNSHQPGTVQTVVTLPGNVDNLTATHPSFTCGNLRWSADGQALLVQLIGSPMAEYDGVVGQAIIPLNGSSSPQILSGCGVSSTATSLQYAGVYDRNCPYSSAVFDWQPSHA